MSETVIICENISKQYRLGVLGSGTLSQDLSRWWAKIRGKEDPFLKIGTENRLDTVGGDFVWALKDINFEVKQGEVIGIIGKNGAGKSTLLKLLSRVTTPSTGIIKLKGKIASLLEVGTGFHPELTGKENIFLNGAILGMTKSEIRSKIDEIIDFSGIGKYIDTPVKRYSSGMYVRLAFAVAAHLEPDILIVDEVLAVGDAEFQKKALGKMKDISRGQGRTVLFVSHNMQAISLLCNSCVLLENGKVDFIGTTDATINRYLEKNTAKDHLLYENKDLMHDDPYISKVILKTSQPNNYHINGEMFEVELEMILPFDVKKTCLTLNLTNDREVSCLDFSYFDDEKLCSNKGKYKLTCKFPKLRLYMGKYYVTYHFAEPPGGKHFESKYNICSFNVVMFKKNRGDWEWQPHTTTYIEDYNWSVVTNAKIL